MNNKAQGGLGIILIFFVVIAVLLVGAFGVVILSSVINYASDNIVPAVSGIGVVGSANFTDLSDKTLTPVNTVVQSFTWMAGIMYVMALIGLFGLAVIFRATTSRVLIPLFIMLAFIIIIASIFMSNIYQDVLSTNNAVTSIMLEHTLMNYMILQAPIILTFVIFISGIILFSGINEGDFI